MKQFEKLMEDYTDFLNKTDFTVCGMKHTFKEGDKAFVQFTGNLNPDVKEKVQWLIKSLTKDNIELESLVKTFGSHDVESEKAIDKDDYFKEVKGDIKIKTKDITKISWGDDYWIIEITNYEPEVESEIELEKSKEVKIADKEKEGKPEIDVRSGKTPVKVEKTKPGEIKTPAENKDLKKINKTNESVKTAYLDIIKEENKEI